MSHVREVSEVLDLCSEQGFRVQKLERSGAWRVWPKTSDQQAIVIHDGRSRSSSQTKYLNTRSALRRIGVKFPELDERQQKPKEDPPMQNRTSLSVPIAQSLAANNPGPAPAKLPTSAFARVREKMDALNLALMDLDEAVNTAEKEIGAGLQAVNAMREAFRNLQVPL